MIEAYIPMHNIESKIVLFRKGRELLSQVIREAMQKIDKRSKRSRLSRNSRHGEHRKRYAEWVAKNVIYVSQWKTDPETGERVIDESAPKERLDLRNAFVSWTNDGLKVGMVLGKRSTAINSTYGDTVIYCNGKEVMEFDMVSGPPRKYQRNGWMMLMHLEKLVTRKPKGQWAVCMTNAGKGFSVKWNRLRKNHWVITKVMIAD